MHVSAYQFFVDRAAALPRSRFVVEVGGRDVNGSIKDLFPTDRYLCLDLHPGANVDVVADATVWTPPTAPDLILCAEVLEHAPDAAKIIANCHEWLAPGGVLLLATVGDPWPSHSGYEGGALRPGEFYRSVEALDLGEWLRPFEAMSYACDANGDRFAVGIKAGGSLDVDLLWPEPRQGVAGLRLNIGCGDYRLDGWVNIDSARDSAADVIAKVPPLAYGDGTVSEIYAGHVLEHLPRERATEFLAECYRVLCPDGKIGMVVPDTREIMRAYVAGMPLEIEYPPGTFWSCADLEQVCEVVLFSTVQESPHLWAYDQQTLRAALETAGFAVTREIDRHADPRIPIGAWYQVGLDAVKVPAVVAV